MKTVNDKPQYRLAIKHIKPHALLLAAALSMPTLAACSEGHEAERHAERAAQKMADKEHQDHNNKEDDHNGNGNHDNSHHGGDGFAGDHAMQDTASAMQDTVSATVVAVDTANRQLTLNHEALPTIGMDAMTMPFSVDEDVELSGLAEGDRIRFTVAMVQSRGLLITQVTGAE